MFKRRLVMFASCRYLLEEFSRNFANKIHDGPNHKVNVNFLKPPLFLYQRFFFIFPYLHIFVYVSYCYNCYITFYYHFLLIVSEEEEERVIKRVCSFAIFLSH